jgi:hypothetical protein
MLAKSLSTVGIGPGGGGGKSLSTVGIGPGGGGGNNNTTAHAGWSKSHGGSLLRNLLCSFRFNPRYFHQFLPEMGRGYS